MTTWPATVPWVQLAEPLALRPSDNVIRTGSVDAGVPKVRRAFSQTSSTFPVRLKLTLAEWQALDAFYEDDAGGIDTFDFPHPASDELVLCRFLSRPVITALAVTSELPANRSFFVDFDLEMLPS